MGVRTELECDECGAAIDFDNMFGLELREEIRDEGWKIFNKSTPYVLCNTCIGIMQNLKKMKYED